MFEFRLRTALQIAADEVIFVDTEFEGCSTGVLGGANAKTLRQRENALDTADSSLATVKMDLLAE